MIIFLIQSTLYNENHKRSLRLRSAIWGSCELKVPESVSRALISVFYIACAYNVYKLVITINCVYGCRNDYLLVYVLFFYQLL